MNNHILLQSEISKLPELIEKWVEGYKWREKVRHAAGVNMKDMKVRATSCTDVSPSHPHRRPSI